jgi:hypothetical protein
MSAIKSAILACFQAGIFNITFNRIWMATLPLFDFKPDNFERQHKEYLAGMVVKELQFRLLIFLVPDGIDGIRKKPMERCRSNVYFSAQSVRFDRGL